MFYIGIDLGQRRDHSAIAVVERMDEFRAYQEPQFHHLRVRYLERVALGMPYSAVVDRVEAVTGSVGREGKFGLIVDATGVGAPVVDLLRAARLGGEITAVTITGGDKATQTSAGWNVPKTDLMAGLQVLIEKDQLKIAKGLRDAGALVKELVDVRTVARGTGSPKVGADGDGQHDDLVIAVALACWKARQTLWGFGTRRLL
jgi:threonine dehydrogenase-like Zn-dependent dehydrogenase